MLEKIFEFLNQSIPTAWLPLAALAVVGMIAGVATRKDED